MNRWRKFCFWSKHVSSQIWCYLKLVRWRVRWRDEQIKKFFFWSKHVSSQIWCYLKLVRWRDEEWDEEMNRWRKNFFWSEHVSSQIWCYLKLVRWRDEQMKKFFFGSEHVSSQIWCYLKLVRWRDEQMKKNFFWVQTCIKPNLVLSEISEMKSEMNRWRKFFFGSEHVSSQIWCYLKLVRWRVRWDEQMKKNFFLVQTCIKPNLVLSEISEMKSEMNRSTDEENVCWVHTCIKSNLVLSEISEMKRWRVRWRDEEIFFLVWTCIKPNLVLSEISEMKSEMKRWKKIFWGPNMYQAKSVVKNFSLYRKSYIQADRQTDKQTYGHHSD